MSALLLLVALSAPGVRSPVELCGNGRIDTFNRLDTGSCPPCTVCPPGKTCPECVCQTIARPEEREPCDGRRLGGMSCTSLGYVGGRLACQSDCSGFDVSRCRICRAGRGVRCLPPAEVTAASPADLTGLTGATSGGEGRLAWIESSVSGHSRQTRVMLAAIDANGETGPARHVESPIRPGGESLDLVGTDDGWLLAVGDDSTRPRGATQLFVVPRDGEPHSAGRFEGVERPLLVPMAEGRWVLTDRRPQRAAPGVHWIGGDGMPIPAPDAAWGARFGRVTVAVSRRDGVLGVVWRMAYENGSTLWSTHHIEWDAGQSEWQERQAEMVPLPHGRLLTIDRRGAVELAPDGTARIERDPYPAFDAVFRGAETPVMLRFAGHRLFVTLWSGDDRPRRLYVARTPLRRP